MSSKRRSLIMSPVTGPMSPGSGPTESRPVPPPPPPAWPQSAASAASSTDALSRDADRAPSSSRSSSKTRAHAWPGAGAQSTIRAVTPEPLADDVGTPMETHGMRGFGPASAQASPRSIPGGEARRQGMVFNDSFGESFESAASSPQQQRGAVRPRTQTLDGALALRTPQPTAGRTDSRPRVGSLSSPGTQPFLDADTRSPPTTMASVGFPSVTPARPPDLKISLSNQKDKRSNNRRLVKRTSRPTSPLVSPAPCVDSLPFPVSTQDANKILSLMRTLCGRMMGRVEYQGETGMWYAGKCWIDEDKGSLLFDPGHGDQFHITLMDDLRGCRVLPVEQGQEDDRKCLELLNNRSGVELLLRPQRSEEYDLWLAGLLCWQQLVPNGGRANNGSRGGNSPVPRVDGRKRTSSATGGASGRDHAIIKVGKVMLWDKGVATSPRAIVKRPSTRDLRSASSSWRRVSCILQDNGEFKLMTENDVAILSVIDLSQLSRCAVQQLDKSVLDEEFCIAIFPIYSATSRQLSIFRPIYLALDSRVLLEVWFVLLRAFAVPDLYGIDPTSDSISEIRDVKSPFNGQVFRVEKTLQVRVTEAKLRKPGNGEENHDRHGRDRDTSVGNYFAEVIMDGEVRARTPIQTETRNPFWRESTQFSELPATLPSLSVVLKRVDGNTENMGHFLQTATHTPKSGNLMEYVCGSVEFPLDKFEKGKDHEEWLPIEDGRGDTIGTMFVKINHDELIVLGRQDYQSLSDLLHKFSIGLTSHIALAIPPALRRLAEVFLNIFQVSGTSVEWMMALVEEEIDGLGIQNSMKKMRFNRRLKSDESQASASDREALVRDMSKSLAGETNLLFRGNPLLTQSLEFHMRRLGKEYLEEILCDKINEINDLNPDCEVDPSRIRDNDQISAHWAQLIQLTTEVWECIAISAVRLPSELRQILKFVRAVAEDRYGDFLRTVNYTSVSGFLFLRFICPAILNPKLFGVLRDNPRPRAQRTLTLIAKGLQALANLATFGKKESWMEPMNKFLGANRQPFKDFIDLLCSVSSERSLLVLPAGYSTPNTITSRLTPLAREGCPSLPYLVDQSRNYAILVKIWLEHNKLSNNADTYVYDNELAEFHDLCMALQERSDEILAKMEVLRSSEAESEATQDVLDAMEKASLIESINQSYGGQPWMDNDPYRAPGSSGSEREGDSNGERFGHRGFGREASGLRQVSDTSAMTDGGTMRVKRREGRDPRSFLSGLIGKKEKVGSSSVRDKSREKDDRGGGSNRGLLSSFSESWQSDSGSRH